MGKYIIKRISYIPLAFVVLSFLLFMIYHMLPVDKAAEKAKEEVQANKTLNYEERYQNWKVEYGFDGAKFERYLRWLGVSIPGGLCSTSRSSTKSVALTSGLRYNRELSVGLAVRYEDEFEWCRFVGTANLPTRSEGEPTETSLHKRRRDYNKKHFIYSNSHKIYKRYPYM
jgi:hypothetical protein